MTGLLVSFAALLAQSAIASPAPYAAVQVPPPIATGSAERTIVRWTPGEVRCGEARPDASGLRAPWPDLSYAGLAARMSDLTYSFAIDAQGRVVSLTPLGQPGTVGGTVVGGTDVGPSLSASRFPAGQPHETCLVTYAPASTPVSSAKLADLLQFSVRPGPLRLPKEGWDRIAASFDCMRSPRPQALERHYPDHRLVAETPGQQEWALAAFDLDASGSAVDARIIEGSGSPQLNDAVLKAVAANRFSSGSRKGCLQPFVRRAGDLPAPPLPPTGESDSPDGACGGKGFWTTEPRLVYPAAYRERSIEGWARLIYDVAPWGAIDNVRVIESQPSADFGREAQVMLRQAKVTPQGTGATGCRQTVRFQMGPATTADETPATD